MTGSGPAVLSPCGISEGGGVMNNSSAFCVFFIKVCE